MKSLSAATHALIQLALTEDVGTGDVTAHYFTPATARTKARIFAKEPGVLAGATVAEAVFHAVDAGLAVRVLRQDGDTLKVGDTVLEISGLTRSILTAERTALNFLQRLSGVATQTHRYVQAMGPTKCRLLDTRKTTPGWRALEKDAVKAGGGTNHRIGLYDMAMVKDNHLLAEAGLPALQHAIDALHRDHPGMRVELEADRIAQVEGFLTLRGVSVILLDNMSLEEMARCVALVDGRVQLEASGGVTLERLAKIAATGVDFISCGALTHSAKALDLSLELLEA
jgi:nicotinate-nucleotide pyrophosphorylase (carboxylating)